MNAGPILKRVAALLAKHRLDAVLIGNAAAALQGAPVTTVDLDFMFRKTPGRWHVALRKESDRAVRELIRRLLALPMHRRTQFLRKRFLGGSAL